MSTRVQATVPLQELEKANLRTAVAVDLSPLVCHTLEDHDACLLVVDDVVACWLRLSVDVRERCASLCTYSLFSNFVGAYVDEVDRAWEDSYDDTETPVSLHESVAEKLCRATWRKHVARLRERATANEPPSEEWLERLAVAAVRVAVE